MAKIDPYGFDPPPVMLTVILASLLLLMLSRKYGRSITPRSGKNYDLFIDIVILLEAAAVAMAASGTPLIGSLTSSLVRHMDQWSQDNVVIGTVRVVGIVIVGVVVFFFGYTYHKNVADSKIPLSRSRIVLTLFAVSFYALCSSMPFVGDLLSFLVDPVAQTVWNGFMGFLNGGVGTKIIF